MAIPKVDGVVEAVHYGPDGKVIWVRVYERRGPAFSDRLVIDRRTFIERIQAGRKYVVGERLPLMASSFKTSLPIRYIEKGDGGILASGEDSQAGRDRLSGVPIV